MIAPERLIEVSTRHQVYLERLKTGEANKYASFLQDIDRQVRLRLAGKDLTSFTRNRLEKLVDSVSKDISIIQGDWRKAARADIIALAQYEAGFEVRALQDVIQHNFTTPDLNQLRSAIMTNPLQVIGIDNGRLLDPFMREWTGKTEQRVSGAIRAGYYQGQTTNQILQTIRGTRAGRFQDGILAMSNKDASMMVRTAVQHAATQAREQVWQDNSDIVKKVRWVSTLDSSTTEQCAALDGLEFPIDSGPRPPIHIGCRSTVVAVLDERFAVLREGATRSSRGADGVESVDANQTYYSWLKTQPAAFQDSAIGVTRGRLLRDGGLSAQRFQELSIGKTWEPLTIAEMRQLEPTAFSTAGL